MPQMSITVKWTTDQHILGQGRLPLGMRLTMQTSLGILGMLLLKIGKFVVKEVQRYGLSSSGFR